jgi:hypothetical protein
MWHAWQENNKSYKLMAGKPNWKRMPERHKKKKSRQNWHKTGWNEASLTLFRPRADTHFLPLNHKKICIFNEPSVCVHYTWMIHRLYDNSVSIACYVIGGKGKIINLQLIKSVFISISIITF